MFYYIFYRQSFAIVMTRLCSVWAEWGHHPLTSSEASHHWSTSPFSYRTRDGGDLEEKSVLSNLSPQNNGFKYLVNLIYFIKPFVHSVVGWTVLFLSHRVLFLREHEVFDFRREWEQLFVDGLGVVSLAVSSLLLRLLALALTHQLPDHQGLVPGQQLVLILHNHRSTPALSPPSLFTQWGFHRHQSTLNFQRVQNYMVSDLNGYLWHSCRGAQVQLHRSKRLNGWNRYLVELLLYEARLFQDWLEANLNAV